MPNRGAGGVSYRYGFNGKETENDVKGIGNEQDYGMRIYDPRLGRFLSVDPLAGKFAWNSTYAFAENDIISSIDLDGLERLIMATERKTDNDGLPYLSRHLYSNPNKEAWKLGLIGHYDSNNKFKIVDDINELSDFDKSVYNYYVETMKESNNYSGVSKKISEGSSINLKEPIKGEEIKRDNKKKEAKKEERQFRLPNSFTISISDLFLLGTTPTLPGGIKNGAKANFQTPALQQYTNTLRAITNNRNEISSVTITIFYTPSRNLTSDQKQEVDKGVEYMRQQILNDLRATGVNAVVNIDNSGNGPARFDIRKKKK